MLRSGAPGLFVKQMREMQPDAMLTLRREATCYQIAAGHPALSRLMPKLVRYEPTRHVLVLELLPEAESLLGYYARMKGFPAEIGRLLGHGLGVYHSQAGGLLKDERLSGLLTRQIPVILTLGRSGHGMLGNFGRIGPAVSALLQQHADFQALLDALGAEWRFDSLIHGDMKWDNVLVFPAPVDLDFRIVDWEMADCGDAGWDVGAVFQSFSRRGSPRCRSAAACRPRPTSAWRRNRWRRCVRSSGRSGKATRRRAASMRRKAEASSSAACASARRASCGQRSNSDSTCPNSTLPPPPFFRSA